MEGDLSRKKNFGDAPPVKRSRTYNATGVREEVPLDVRDHSLPHISGVVEQDRRRFTVSFLRAQIICKDPVNTKVDRERVPILPATLSPISTSSSSGRLSRTARSNNSLQSRAFS